MVPIKKNQMMTFLIGVFFLFMIPINGYTRIAANGSAGGYDEDGGSGTLSAVRSGNTIDMYVIEGAGYYLNAYSEILAFLNRVEESDLKGLDYIEARQILERTLNHLTNALKTYYFLIRRVEVTPYKPQIIAKLMEFDYMGFMEKWSLNNVVFNQVEEFLRKGDITGMYKHIYSQFVAITGIVYAVNAEISMGRIPPLSVLWKLNECCSHTMLFSQYVSRVFYEVLELPI